MRGHWLAGLLAVVALLPGHPAEAADKHWDWSGFYVGGHLGSFTGTTNFSNPEGPSIFGDVVTTPGFMVGLQGGYNWLFQPQWLAGVEGTASVLAAQGHNTCFQASYTFVGSDCYSMPRQLLTLAGRLGYLPQPGSRTMFFGKAGVAWMHSDVSASPNNSGFPGFTTGGDPNVTGDPIVTSISSWGWTVGAGMEYALGPRWAASVEYDYLRLNGGSIETPQTISSNSTGHLTTMPGGGVAGISQDMHLFRLGLNYRLDGDRSKEPSDQAADETSWQPHWEFEGGARYWFSWGNFQSSNGGPTTLVSRLPYNNMEGHSGELFARLDAPFNVFVKGLIGGGGISNGNMYDEDWGLGSNLADQPTGYEVTVSGVNGSFNYFTFDVGYDLMRGADHKVGLFVGYNRYQTVMNTLGCMQLVAPDSGVCAPNIPSDVNGISEMDTWHSLRLGTSAQVVMWDRVKIDADVAFLPYVYVDGLDIHRLRNLFFPVTGTGNGVQAELMLSYRVTDALSIGLGGRYWAMWTTNANQPTQPTNFLTLSTDRYGVLAQAAYKFN